MTGETSFRVRYESDGEEPRECSWGDLNQDFWRHWEAYNEGIMYQIQDAVVTKGSWRGYHDFGEYRITRCAQPEEAP